MIGSRMFRRHSLIAPIAVVLALSHPATLAAQAPAHFRVDVRNVSPASNYDTATKTYRQEYVTGKATLHLDACFSLVRKEVTLPLEKVPGDPQTKPIKFVVLVAPNGAHTYVWRLTNIATGNSRVEQKKVKPAFGTVPSDATAACSMDFEIRPGNYRIDLEILLATGKLPHSQEISVGRPLLVASVGDSYASGQGNPDKEGLAESDLFGQRDCEDDTTVMLATEGTSAELKPKMHSQPRWLEASAYRSLKSGPAIAARFLDTDYGAVTFISFAVTGDTSKDVIDQVAQLSSNVGDQRIDALLVSAGGNDVGFGDGLRDMAKLKSTTDIVKEFDKKLPKLPERLENLFTQISKLNVGKVFWTAYPTALFDDSSGVPAKGCGVFDTPSAAILSAILSDGIVRINVGVSQADAFAVENMALRLNNTLRSFAKNHGIFFIETMVPDFERHGYCRSESETFFVGAQKSCEQQGDFKGTMHPNERGSAAYGRRIAEAIHLQIGKLPGSDPTIGP